MARARYAGASRGKEGGRLRGRGAGLAYCLAKVRKHPNLSLAIAAPEKHSDPSKVTWLLPSKVK